MRVVVDLTRCQGYGQCVFMAPEVFAMNGREALAYDPQPTEAHRESVLRAAAACPVQALHVDRADTRTPDHDTDHHDTGPDTGAGTRRRSGPYVEAGLDGDRFRRHGRVVIVGASLAGLRAAAALRAEGFTGSLTLVGDEPGEPYDRPPLSKQVLTGQVTARTTALPQRDDLDAEWLCGVPATGLDLGARRVHLEDGRAIGFDRLLIATGTRARPWPDEDEAALDGVCTLRTAEDAGRLRARLTSGTGRVLVIGGGFTGSEIASVCRELGRPVTVAERGPAPLVGALGGVIGAVAADLQCAHGVDLRCGVSVTALEGDGAGRLCRARLSDGTTLEVDLAVAALGAVRNVEWLEGSGLAAGPWGVACDAGCRVFDINGLVTDDVFAAGDVARLPHPVYEYQFLSLEHWGSAIAQAEIAAHNMVNGQTRRWPYLSLPVFWSSQFGVEIKSVGVPTFADEVMITQGAVEEHRFVAVYGYRRRITAAVTFDQGMWLEFYQGLIERAAPFPPRFHTIDEPAAARPVPAERRAWLVDRSRSGGIA